MTKIQLYKKIVINFVFCLSITNVTWSMVMGEIENSQFWVSIFPIDTTIHTIAIDHQDTNIICASTYKGLFKSGNGGELWNPLMSFKPDEPSGRLVWSIIKINPVDSKILYLGISREEGSGYFKGKLWKSKDGGVTWEDIGAGVIKAGVYDIAINPKSPEIIYVASYGNAEPGGGLYKTLNGGKTWGKIAEPAFSVFIDTQSPDEVFASLVGRYGWVNLYHSNNGGQSFNLLKPTFTALTRTIFGMERRGKEAETGVYASLNPHDSQQIFAVCTATANTGNYFLKSQDKGENWQVIMAERVNAWAFDPKDKDVIYIVAKIYNQENREYVSQILKSVDGGKTWAHLPTPLLQHVGYIEIAAPNTIYLVTDYGIYKTANDGKNWEARSLGLPAKIGNRELLCVDAESGSIYVGEENGYYWVSKDKGVSWQWYSAPDYLVKQIIVIPNEVTYVISKSKTGIGSFTDSRLFKATPTKKLTKIEVNSFPRYLVVSPSNSQVLYLIATDEKYLINDNDFPSGVILLKSEDGGFSWIKVDYPADHMILLTVDSRSSHTLYGVVKIENRYKLIKTTDGGTTWIDITSGLYRSITSIWSSSNWLNQEDLQKVADILFSSPTSLVIDPSDSNIVYITTSAGGVYRSDDRGKTWKSKSLNYLKTLMTEFDNYWAQQYKGQKDRKAVIYGSSLLPTEIWDKFEMFFSNVAVNPLSPSIIYLATNKGIYRSADRGDTWQSFNRGLLDTAIRKVIASSIILSEGENGIYKLSE